MNERVLIVSPSFYPDESYTEKLYKSCQIFNLPLAFYGQNQSYNGWIDTKVTKLLEFIEPKLDNYDILIFADGGDTWFLTGLGEIIEKYRKLNSTHIISGERECYPFREHASKYLSRIPEGYTNNWYYINCGLQIGNIKTIYNTWKIAATYEPLVNNNNDAALLSTAFIDNKVDFTIDYNCELFCGMGGRGLWETLEIKNNRIYNKLTSTYPCAVHFNSMPKEPDMSQLWSASMSLEYRI